MMPESSAVNILKLEAKSKARLGRAFYGGETFSWYSETLEKKIEKPVSFFLDQIPYLKIKDMCSCGCETVWFDAERGRGSEVGAVTTFLEEESDLTVTVHLEILTGRILKLEVI